MMFPRRFKEVLFINYERGSGCPTSDGPSHLMRLTPKDMVRDFLDEIAEEHDIRTMYYEPRSLDDLSRFLLDAYSPDKIFISPDNLVSYLLFGASQAQGCRSMVGVVGDQHQDIYSYRTHGRDLSKANPYRLALDQGLVNQMIFFGSRKLEMAFHKPSILLPDVLALRRSPLDFLYALYRHWQGQHAGFSPDTIFAIPADEENDFFADVVAVIAERLDDLRPHCFSFEIDLDVFDSEAITGVDYGPHLPGRLRRDAWERLKSSGWGLLRLDSLRCYFYDRWVASYVGHKINCPGVAMPASAAIEEAFLHLHILSPLCSFFHITELKLEHDDPSGRTRRLVKDLIGAAIRVSGEKFKSHRD